MESPNQPTNEELIALIRWDSRRQTESALAKLTEVLDCLRDDNHLGALGAFRSLDEDMARLKVFLARIAWLTGLGGAVQGRSS